MWHNTQRRLTWMLGLALLVTPWLTPLTAQRTLHAQSVQGQLGTQSRLDDPALTRRELIARVIELEQRALALPDGEERTGLVMEARGLRERLRDGDFDVGDQLVLRVAGHPALSDTFVVRAGRMLEFPDLPPMPLTGVLRADLPGQLRAHLGKYIINPTVDVYPLVRVAVLGAVAKPGFYAVRGDQLVSDAIMAAGGPSTLARVDETLVRRGKREVYTPKRLRDALAAGQTLDQLGIRSGDEIVVAERTRRDWVDIVRTGAYIAALAASIWAGGSLF